MGSQHKLFFSSTDPDKLTDDDTMACVSLGHLKKYRTRPSPPKSAQACKNVLSVGNDGGLYVSKANKKGIHRWQKVGGKGTASSRKKKAKRGVKKTKKAKKSGKKRKSSS